VRSIILERKNKPCKLGYIFSLLTPTIARHSDNKIRSTLADRGNTAIFEGYSNIHQKDVYQSMNIATKKTMLSRDVILLNRTFSQHMGISQVYYVSNDVEAQTDVWKKKKHMN
jgi:hypothetical protein